MKTNDLKWFKYRGVYISAHLQMEREGDYIKYKSEIYATRNIRVNHEVKPLRTTFFYGYRVDDQLWSGMQGQHGYYAVNNVRPDMALSHSSNGAKARDCYEFKQPFIAWEIRAEEKVKKTYCGEETEIVRNAEKVYYGSLQDNDHLMEWLEKVENGSGAIFFGWSWDVLYLISDNFVYSLVSKYDGETEVEAYSDWRSVLHGFLKRIGTYATHNESSCTTNNIPEIRLSDKRPLTPLNGVRCDFYDDDSGESFYITRDVLRSNHTALIIHRLESINRYSKVQSLVELSDLSDF